MKKILLIFSIMAFLVVSCESPKSVGSNENDDVRDLKTLYISLSKIDNASIFGLRAESRSDSFSGKNILSFDENDLSKLSSLSKSELYTLRNDLVQTLGVNGDDIVDSLYYMSYDKILIKIGGREKMQQLLDFTDAYIQSYGGWNDIMAYMPLGMTTQDKETYIATAVCVDKVIRPLYNTVVNDIPIDSFTIDNPMVIRSLEGKTLCDIQLSVSLAIAGVGITAEAFLDAVSAGTLTEIEAVATAVNLLDIWLDYETCKNRVH